MSKAWMHAQAWASRLHSRIEWAFCITETPDDAVFNIWAPRPEWHRLRLLLALGDPDETNEDSLTWQFEGVALSFIQPEEKHGSDEPDGAADRG